MTFIIPLFSLEAFGVCFVSMGDNLLSLSFEMELRFLWKAMKFLNRPLYINASIFHFDFAFVYMMTLYSIRFAILIDINTHERSNNLWDEWSCQILPLYFSHDQKYFRSLGGVVFEYLPTRSMPITFLRIFMGALFLVHPLEMVFLFFLVRVSSIFRSL